MEDWSEARTVSAIDDQDDVVIALFGAAGSGKSNFIDKATRRPAKAGEGLGSATQGISATMIEVIHESASRKKIVLVDIPGFADRQKPDARTLKMVSDWLGWETGRKLKFSGAIYCHPIIYPRMPGSNCQNLNMIKALCYRFAPMVFLTTFWDADPDKKLLQRREEQLVSYCEDMLAQGWDATMERFDNDEKSARSIILSILGRIGDLRKEDPEEQNALRVRYATGVEVQDGYRYLGITRAGKKARDELEVRLHECQTRKDALQAQLTTAQHSEEHNVVERLKQKIKGIDKEIENMKKTRRELQTSIGRRFHLFLQRKMAGV